MDNTLMISAPDNDVSFPPTGVLDVRGPDATIRVAKFKIRIGKHNSKYSSPSLSYLQYLQYLHSPSPLPCYPLIGYGHEESFPNKSFFQFSAMKGNNDRNPIEARVRWVNAEWVIQKVR